MDLFRRLGPAARVVVVVMAIHATWIVAYLAFGYEARDFIRIGSNYVQLGIAKAERHHVEPILRLDPSYDYPANRDRAPGIGYDGQTYYYLALDLADARYYMDAPGYRYSRIFYPLAARGLALGNRDAIPYALILINWLAIGLGTLALAAWLRRHSFPPWPAAVYGLYPGLLTGLQRDLSEPLAYGLAAWGVYLFEFGGRRRIVWAGLVFALAALTKQSTAVFPAVYALSLVLNRQRATWRDHLHRAIPKALALAGLALAPVAVWMMVVSSWIGPIQGDYTESLPFLGLVKSTPWELVRQPPVIFWVVIPSLAVGAVAVRALLREPRRPEIHLLLVNIVLFVLLLGRIVYSGGYTGVGRNTTGVVLSAILAAPYLVDFAPESRLLRAAPAALALSAFPVMLVYEFTGLNV